MRLPVNWEYLEKRFKEESVTKKGISELLGHSETFLSMSKSKNLGLPSADIEKIRDLMEIDMKQLVPRKERKEDEKTDDEKTIEALIAEVGVLRNRIVQLEKKLEEPVIVAIPMKPAEMAEKIVGECLESGWCTKDKLLVEFNKHHVPTQYMSDAVSAHDAVYATSGIGSSMRTYIIKGGAGA